MSVNRMSCQIPCSWANLPSDLLLSIADSLDVATTIRLSAVCISWASTIRPCLPSFPTFCCDQPIPWLLCSAQKSDTGLNRSDLTFYDLSTATYYSVGIPIPSLCDHHWLGSYKGWLVTLDKQLQLHLIKPLTGAHVLLPSKGIEKEHPKKVILCHCPDNTNKLQAFCLTQQGGLVSTKLGDDSWTWMANNDAYFQDIVVYQGKLYAVSINHMHVLSCWDVQSFSTNHMIVVFGHYLGWPKYLLEWNGELFMLQTDKEEMISLENHTSNQIKLFKLTRRFDVWLLSLVRSLRDNALILDVNCSYVISSSCHDDIQPNHIYYTNQVWRCFHDTETSHSNHNLGKQTYKPCCQHDSPMHMTSPICFWPF